MKILFILSFLMACNFLLRIFSRLKLGIYWDWKNYENYTSALTNVRDLFIGWRH